MTWILLRGLTREARHWGTFPARFAAALGDGQRVVALDLPGNGAEHRTLSPATVDGMIAFIRTRAIEAALRGPFSLLALSLGGMVATAWAQTHPDEIERLVLINTSMRPFGWPHQRLRWQAWPTVLRLLSSWNDALACERVIHRLTCADTSQIDRDVAQWAAIRADAPVSRGNALRQLLAAARFHAGRTAPPCPTLLLSSAEDKLVAQACSISLARHWACAHAVHGHAGHDVPHDDPEWVARRIAAWLREPHSHGHITC